MRLQLILEILVAENLDFINQGNVQFHTKVIDLQRPLPITVWDLLERSFSSEGLKAIPDVLREDWSNRMYTGGNTPWRFTSDYPDKQHRRVLVRLCIESSPVHIIN